MKPHKKSNSTKCSGCNHVLGKHDYVDAEHIFEIGGKCLYKDCDCKHFVMPGPTSKELNKFYYENPIEE